MYYMLELIVSSIQYIVQNVHGGLHETVLSKKLVLCALFVRNLWGPVLIDPCFWTSIDHMVVLKIFSMLEIAKDKSRILQRAFVSIVTTM